MYWIYLIIFILMVMVPGIIKNPVFLLSEENAEEAIIFLLGIIGFLIFNYKERQLSFNLKERLKIQKEATKTSKDLTHSYSYIGEINRKLEILNNISLKLAEAPRLTPAKRKRVCDLILKAIKALAKTSQFTVYFANLTSKKILNEIRGENKEFPMGIKNLIFSLRGARNLIEINDYLIIKSAKNINGAHAFIIIKIKGKQASENIKLLQTLATQSLLLFSLSKKAGSKSANSLC